MQNSRNYWTQTLVTRRRALRVAAGGAAFGALSLVGCGGGSDSGGSGGSTEIKDIGNVPRVTEEESKKGARWPSRNPANRLRHDPRPRNNNNTRRPTWPATPQDSYR